VLFPLRNLLFALPWLYLDPGSGSFIIQLVIAAALGVGVAARMYWTKIKGLFTGKKSQSSQSSEEADAR